MFSNRFTDGRVEAVEIGLPTSRKRTAIRDTLVVPMVVRQSRAPFQAVSQTGRPPASPRETERGVLQCWLPPCAQLLSTLSQEGERKVRRASNWQKLATEVRTKFSYPAVGYSQRSTVATASLKNSSR